MTTSESARQRKGHLAVTLTASGGTFLAMLDSTVTNLAVPDLAKDFSSASLSGLSWVISAYAVLLAALLVPAGRLSDVLGRRRLFLLGIGIFTTASLLCGIAPNLPVLIATRALQGAGAAAMIPASLAILLLDGPADQRVKSIGLWSAASAFAAAVGPSVGGVLVDLFGWRSVFYVNLPFGLLLIFAAIRLLPRTAGSEDRRIPDPLGTLLVALAVGAMTLGVTEGGTWGWWDGRTLACVVGGAALAVVAVLRSRKHPVPALETTLLGNRTFAVTNVVSLLYGMAQYPWLLVSVLYLTGSWHYSELKAGFAMTPGAVAASVAALALSRLAPRLGGPRVATLAGLLAFVVCGLWLVLGLTDTPSFLTFWLPAGCLAGIAMGAATMGTSAAAALSAPPTRFAAASGMNTTARQFGGALGIAALAVIMQQRIEDGGTNLDAYTGVFAFSTVVAGMALVISLFWLRITPPPVAAASAAKPGTASPATEEGSRG
ncbi:DHA2 family efflux MFS transporter permease subunit [Streptomyces europaeiscabiei]|uniref:DHA2 family efflux MFS transporter permease subunit n=1 Tax=Streptomyces europaeiscabiei TaxID=146819 RepID=UPI002E10A269|nr:DHA2 family efflux MFS transporter permease subunit [Streptomyces europaeiscabiei]